MPASSRSPPGATQTKLSPVASLSRPCARAIRGAVRDRGPARVRRGLGDGVVLGDARDLSTPASICSSRATGRSVTTRRRSRNHAWSLCRGTHLRVGHCGGGGRHPLRGWTAVRARAAAEGDSWCSMCAAAASRATATAGGYRPAARAVLARDPRRVSWRAVWRVTHTVARAAR